MSTETFQDLSLIQPLLDAIAEEGYQYPTPIQLQAIPEVLSGRDLLATAQTGTGKTAAFALPILQLLSGSTRRTKGRGAVRSLILTPTRELALQIDDSFRSYGRHLPFRRAVVLGGVSSVSQIEALRKSPEVLVATPGRLLDLFGQGYIRLAGVEILVLDEADRMLDMGFIHDVRRIVSKLPKNRQTLFFSATLSSEILALASDMLDNPAEVAVTPPASVSDDIAQKVFFVRRADKDDLLIDLLNDKNIERALVFTRTKFRANTLLRMLLKKGVSVDAIHSDKTQGARQQALSAFDRGKIKVLIGTDIVARGIDVDGISHVINYEMPSDAEGYVHRIGRTARAGANGVAISLCDAGDVALLSEIEKLTGTKPVPVEEQPYHAGIISDMYSRATAAITPLEDRPKFGRKRRMPRRSMAR